MEVQIGVTGRQAVSGTDRSQVSYQRQRRQPEQLQQNREGVTRTEARDRDLDRTAAG